MTRSRVMSRSGSSLRRSLPPVSCCGEGKTRLDSPWEVHWPILHTAFCSSSPPFKKVCDVSGAKVFKSIKKDARVFVIDHCGHALSVEQPKRCALLIENLISQGRWSQSAYISSISLFIIPFSFYFRTYVWKICLVLLTNIITPWMKRKRVATKHTTSQKITNINNRISESSK